MKSLSVDRRKQKYEKLISTVNKIRPYYDIDKIKNYSVYVWTKGEKGENVFDILPKGIVFYDEKHKIIKEAKPIIKEIQKVLKEIEVMYKFKEGKNGANL